MPTSTTNQQEKLIAGQLLSCREKLHDYVIQAWPIVEPATPFIDNWHIGLICEYIQAVSDLQIHNLIINIPPRHMKSLLVSVFWPTWSWIKNPELRWLTGSYAEPLAIRDALKSRRILQSSWYRSAFGHLFNLTTDQNTKNRYENDKTGSRLAFSFNAAVTGEGADILIVDDPLKAQDADSPTTRARVNEIYDTALTTRANDSRFVRRVIIMQRLHQEDLTGHLLAKLQPDAETPHYEHLCLPTEYEPKRYFSSLGLNDPRTQPGELLWPARFGAQENALAKLDLGARAYAGQHAQRPAPQGGSIYLAEWWQGRNRSDTPEDHLIVGRWLSWDTAFKDEEQNDTTALTVWDLTCDYHIFLRHVSWHHYQFPQLANAIVDEAWRWMLSDNRLHGIVIEDKASGISAIQTLQQSAPYKIADLLCPFTPEQYSKAARARQASLWCERGCVLLPYPSAEYPWLFEFEDMLHKFPNAKINDPVDSFTQGIIFLENLLAEGWRFRTTPPPPTRRYPRNQRW